jgi:senataxin
MCAAGRIVLVGDPCQLPPTVLSRAAEAAMLAQSLFERLSRAGWPVTMLREQYRMHPLISAFPSR